MNFIAYLRVSTEQQALSGAGLDAQHDACERVAGSLAGIYRDEGVSGKTGIDKRPALLDAIAQLKKGDVLIVAKRDRLGRDPMVVAMIESAVKRKGARIVSAAGEGTDSDSPTDILMRRMVDAFAEYERLIIGARTKAALQAKKARNESTGYIAYGYQLSDDGVHVEECLEEQATLRKIELLRQSGMSLRKVADELNQLGIFKRGGEKWNHVNLHNVCKRS